MMSYGWVLILFLSAFTGWLANRVLIKLLFHPREPIHFGLFTLQGFFPKQQRKLAEQLGKLVSDELFSMGGLEEKIADPGNFQKLMPLAEEHVDAFLRIKLPQQMPMIGMFIGEKTIGELKTVFLGELETLFPVIMTAYVNGLKQDLNIEQLVSEKIRKIPIDRLEQAFYTMGGKGLRYAGWIGAMVGLVTGILQVVISLWR